VRFAFENGAIPLLVKEKERERERERVRERESKSESEGGEERESKRETEREKERNRETERGRGGAVRFAFENDVIPLLVTPSIARPPRCGRAINFTCSEREGELVSEIERE